MNKLHTRRKPVHLDGLARHATGYYVVNAVFNRALSWHRAAQAAQSQLVYIRKYCGGGAKVVPA